MAGFSSLLVSGVAAASHLLSPCEIGFDDLHWTRLDSGLFAKNDGRLAAAWEGLDWRSFSAELWLEELHVP